MNNNQVILVVTYADSVERTQMDAHKANEMGFKAYRMGAISVAIEDVDRM